MLNNGQEAGLFMDLDTALGRLHGKTDLYRKMLGLFLKSEEFAALEEHLAAGNYEKAEVSAHTIKGMTGNLALNALADTSARLMGELRGGSYREETLSEYRAALAKTRACVEEFCGSA